MDWVVLAERVGDVNIVLYGYTALYVMRPRMNRTLEFVDDYEMHGLTNGEAPLGSRGLRTRYLGLPRHSRIIEFITRFSVPGPQGTFYFGTSHLESHIDKFLVIRYGNY